MNKLPPDVARFFDEQKKEQQFFEKSALAQKNLRMTTITMYDAMDKLAQRGVAVQIVEDASDELLQSSREFLIKTEPWWKCCPSWWCTPRRKPKK